MENNTKSTLNTLFPRNQSTKDVRKASGNRFAFPGISSKVGSLHSFLSIEEFKREVSALPDEAKFFQPVPIKSKARKLYLTMNEELSSTVKKEVSNHFIGQDDQGDSGDERKKLLYDKHIINRQKAAVSICKTIIDEVKAKFGYNDNIESLELTETESNLSDKDELDVKLLVKKSEKCLGLMEKLEKISEISNKFFQSSSKLTASRNTNFLNGFAPKDQEAQLSRESSQQRISKSKEKVTKEDLLMAPANLDELFLEEPSGNWGFKSANSKVNRSFVSFSADIDADACFEYLTKCSQAKPNSQNQIRSKKPAISLNKLCISLPRCKIKSKICLYICYYYTSFKNLLKLDLSNNPIGDKSGAFIVETLSLYSPSIEILDLTNANLSIHSCTALQNYLNKPRASIQFLRISNNLLSDEGLCSIAIGLLINTSLVHLNISNCGLRLASGLAMAKVIRINRKLKSLILSQSVFSGKAIREICRSLIVNSQLLSVSFVSCRLIDDDAKEISHMLNSNMLMQQILLQNNEFTQKGLEWFRFGLSKNKSLVHIGLSGNPEIKLKALEKLKAGLRQVNVDIGKEDDFLKSDEAKKMKLADFFT